MFVFARVLLRRFYDTKRLFPEDVLIMFAWVSKVSFPLMVAQLSGHDYIADAGITERHECDICRSIHNGAGDSHAQVLLHPWISFLYNYLDCQTIACNFIRPSLLEYKPKLPPNYLPHLHLPRRHLHGHLPLQNSILLALGMISSCIIDFRVEFGIPPINAKTTHLPQHSIRERGILPHCHPWTSQQI
jgi:hypothetical protein